MYKHYHTMSELGIDDVKADELLDKFGLSKYKP